MALEFLKDGQSFKLGDLRLGMNGNCDMYITGWTQFESIENLTKSEALHELDIIKNMFQQILDQSQELKDFIEGKRIKYNLAFNYGMGAIGICSESCGVIEWETKLD